ncbi:hypothetical protein [Streptacidiphilus sp. EB129]|uniref:hypothetical protein n=1 Tax=Streptacidiphilus sp. EB129 TaxID=3156262 RepID=UPI003512E230
MTVPLTPDRAARSLLRRRAAAAGTAALLLLLPVGAARAAAPGGGRGSVPAHRAAHQPSTRPIALSTPASAAAPTTAPNPDHCVPPPGDSATGPVRVALEWPGTPVTPGARPTLGVRVTNTGATATTDPTLVVVHLPAPNSISADPGTGLTLFGTGGQYTVPAGLPAGATAATTLTLDVHPEDPPNATEHCDVSSFTGPDHATVRYDLVTGDPEVTLSILLDEPVSAAPGATVTFGVSAHNAGPSNAYSGTTAISMTAPARTHWAAPAPYGCTADAAQTVLSCTTAGSPLTWRDDYIRPSLTVDRDAVPGTLLAGGLLGVTNPWDCHGPQYTPFTVTVTPTPNPTP